jgi:phage gp46-like protein
MSLILNWNISIERDTDRDLSTYCALALLTRGRAHPDDTVQDPSDLGGWWGDLLPDVPGDQFGSRLWTLQGRNINEALELAPAMAKDALQVGIEEGVFTDVAVTAEIVGPGVLALWAQPTLPGGEMANILGPWYISV